MKTILVVDDDMDNRYVLSRMLQLRGYQVIVATTGAEALQKAREGNPRLILMDLSMPDMDGWTAASLVKASPEIAHIPIIAVTGHVTTDDLQRARQAGCSDHLAKPIDFATLINKVETHAI